MKTYFRWVLLIGLLLSLLLNIPLVASRQQDSSKVELIPYKGNLILTQDKALAWETGGIGRQRVVSHKGLMYMFYLGYNRGQTAGAVGYATSEDGLKWIKNKDNPVFVPDKTIAPKGVMNFALVLNDETWMIYFSPWPSGKSWYEFTGDILMATATSPTGPWTVSEKPVLVESNIRDWDSGGRYLQTVTHNKNGYIMFYNAGGASEIGMAMSSDGISWTKYDDPTTISGSYKNSDPVFAHNQNSKAWDSGFVSGAVVRQTDMGWEMFYGGGIQPDTSRSIGYATSPDGIKWTRMGDSPLLTDTNKYLSPETVAEINGTHYLYYVVISKNWDPEGVAVATITYH